MTVSTFATLAAGLSRPVDNAAKPNAVLSRLISATSDARAKESRDVADFTKAITLQNQVAQFRIASQNVAQAASVLTTADSGAAAIEAELNKLKQIAQDAQDEALSDDERAALNTEFQNTRRRIDRIANSTSFQNEPLLNGTSSQLSFGNENPRLEAIKVASLTDPVLFRDTNLNVLRSTNAQIAAAAVKEAQEYAAQQRANIKTLQESLEYASGALESAIQNREAANSTVSGSDLVAELLGGGNPKLSLLDSGAQVNRLPTNILQLLGE